MSQLSNSGRLEELDGLRALAVSLILVFHAFQGSSVLKGGFLGVDLFFVLSGFVIGRRYMQGLATRREVKHFFSRRAIRLLPALTMMLIVYGFVATLVFDFDHLHKRWLEIPFALSFSINLARVWSPEKIDWLGHLWSLSIEEQFYLIFPVMIFCVRRFSMVEKCMWFCCLAAFCALWRAWSSANGAEWFVLYNRTDFRLDGLLLGVGAAALHLHNPRQRIPKILLIFAAPFMIWAFTFADHLKNSTYNIIFPLFNICAAMLVLFLASSHSSTIQRFFCAAFMVKIGKMSYGIYIWHFIVYQFVWIFSRNPIVVLIYGGTATLLFSLLSYKIIEEPLNQWIKERTA
jgi:peptidoglycan/LPS O-acetylase OafA/YrhL